MVAWDNQGEEGKLVGRGGQHGVVVVREEGIIIITQGRGWLQSGS